MIKKMLQIKGIKELKSSSLKVIHGGNDTNFCTDDLGNISADCHRFDGGYVNQPGTPF
ncbi:hypothetical protein [uncultured Dokdonia sp.]|uniref:hypothetical protein n=1 Tax=uncultured Dokdonia sp. TaxID=575653 RepID=UPI002614448C|nr:hypothetical protein [uncultured Dokdonia sp.]